MRIKLNIKISFTILVGLVVMLSCEKDAATEPISNINHVLLVYMGGDNSLSEETYQKIEALKKAYQPNEKNRLLIYSDPSDDTPRLIEIVKEKTLNVEKSIRVYPEENSANAIVFSSILREVKELYPTSSYGLLLFSHASGWLPYKTLLQPRSIVSDQQYEMDLIDFARALPNHSFDYIIFEACFMSGIEVAYELLDKTDYILASSAEILSPGFTNTYSENINYLFESPANLSKFADKAFAYFNNQSNSDRSATFSIISTNKLNNLADWIKLNCDFQKTTDLTTIQHFDRYQYHLFFDFEDYYSQLLNTKEQKEELKHLIEECVIWKQSTPNFMIEYKGFKIEKHSGLTTYIPQADFPYLNESYKKTKWGHKIFSK